MVFHSLEYFFFLPIVFLVYYFCRQKYRWMVLLAASVFFYASLQKPYLLLVLFGVILVSYFSALRIEKLDEEKAKKKVFVLGVFLNVAVLVAMKYLPFLSENINAILQVLFRAEPLPIPPIIVSIGVSFYVFQAISYLYDVYLGIQKPEKHFGIFALYMSFFPKIMQGPIERGRKLLPQLKQPYEFHYDNMRMGMLLIVWGLFKKVVIADRLGVIVDTVFADIGAYSGIPLFVATYAYAFQIYLDFSGYTDIALGSARLFNIQLTNNFNAPYFATSVADFWRRWHISFSSWLQDYLFKPLQMKWRKWKSWGTVLALLVTFSISGIWHGAAWTFVVWGLLHGIYLAVPVLWKAVMKKKPRKRNAKKTPWGKIFLTFNLVSFAWIFFRAGSFSEALLFFSRLFKGVPGQIASFSSLKDSLEVGLGKFDFALSVAGLSLVLLIETRSWLRKAEPFSRLPSKHLFLRWGIYLGLCLVVLLFPFHQNPSFLYFQF